VRDAGFEPAGWPTGEANNKANNYNRDEAQPATKQGKRNMQLRFRVNQAEALRQGVNAPRSVVTVEVDPYSPPV